MAFSFSSHRGNSMAFSFLTERFGVPVRIRIHVSECLTEKGELIDGHLKKGKEHIEWSLMGEADVRSGR
jgi:hypothetical protein